MKANVHVALRAEILDPEGRAIAHALHSLGYTEVREARVGKTITLTLDGDDRDALHTRVDAMAKELLANPVIENFEVEWLA